jgi:adenosine deaminase
MPARRALSPDLQDFIRALPKAEVHIHLEGSIQPATLLELARRHGELARLPGTDEAGLQSWFQFTDFPHFIDIYLLISSLLRTPDDFALITYACGADMAAQNIRYRELTFTPFTHTHQQAKGLTIDDLLAGLEAGAAAARADFGVEMCWVFDIVRDLCFRPDGGFDLFPAEQTLEYALAGRALGVVGLGLGGYEVGAPPEPFADVFRRGKAAGLLSVPHAGETAGPESIWGALRALQADRIGHGVRAIEDPALVELLRDRKIPLEINPTSNICLHVYPDYASHPFRVLDRTGIPVTVNSDDPPLFATSLADEYGVLAAEFGYDRADLARIARNAFVVSGAPPAVKGRLLGEFEQWVIAQGASDPVDRLD